MKNNFIQISVVSISLLSCEVLEHFLLLFSLFPTEPRCAQISKAKPLSACLLASLVFSHLVAQLGTSTLAILPGNLSPVCCFSVFLTSDVPTSVIWGSEPILLLKQMSNLPATSCRSFPGLSPALVMSFRLC